MSFVCPVNLTQILMSHLREYFDTWCKHSSYLEDSNFKDNHFQHLDFFKTLSHNQKHPKPFTFQSSCPAGIWHKTLLEGLNCIIDQGECLIVVQNNLNFFSDSFIYFRCLPRHWKTKCREKEQNSSSDLASHRCGSPYMIFGSLFEIYFSE